MKVHFLRKRGGWLVVFVWGFFLYSKAKCKQGWSGVGAWLSRGASDLTLQGGELVSYNAIVLCSFSEHRGLFYVV